MRDTIIGPGGNYGKQTNEDRRVDEHLEIERERNKREACRIRLDIVAIIISVIALLVAIFK